MNKSLSLPPFYLQNNSVRQVRYKRIYWPKTPSELNTVALPIKEQLHGWVLLLNPWINWWSVVPFTSFDLWASCSPSWARKMLPLWSGLQQWALNRLPLKTVLNLPLLQNPTGRKLNIWYGVGCRDLPQSCSSYTASQFVSGAMSWVLWPGAGII